MKICFIGNSGHGASAVSEFTPEMMLEVAGYCPGFQGENLDGLESIMKILLFILMCNREKCYGHF